MDGLLLISPKDNVAVALGSLAAGCEVTGQRFVIRQSVKLGDKIAVRDIGAANVILKYGVPIGSATRTIQTGEYVHLHNMKSDYIPTYSREEGRRTGPTVH